MVRFKKNKIYISLGIITLIVLFLVLFVIVPLITQIQSNSQNLLSEKDDTAILKMQSTEIENFKKNYEDYKPNLEQANRLFVDPQNPVDFIKFLEDTASASLVKPNISLTPPNPKDQNTVAFQLFVSDDFSKIQHFVEKLENGPYLLEIRTFSANNTATDTTAKNYPSGKVDASFSINVFAKL